VIRRAIDRLIRADYILGSAMPGTQIIDNLLQAAFERIAAQRFLPESTYRLQFHSGFTFRDAAQIVPYLNDLGITHLYASPILKARPGSTHGYDVIDPRSLNPEFGTAHDFADLTHALREHGMGLILDTVPNHMGIATNDNPWWNDVLENGPQSKYAGWFDIAWRGSPRPELHDKVLLPVLGEPYGEALEKGLLRLTLEAGALAVGYYDRRFPISPQTYAAVLLHRIQELQKKLAWDDPVLAEFSALATQPGAALMREKLAALIQQNQGLREHVEQNLAEFNGTAGDPASFNLLDDLLNQQFYRLAHWRTAPDEINYRRFFDINDLAALCMEREDTFQAVHDLPLRLLADGTLHGLRIDHPDGLYDPDSYFLRLQRHYVLAVARAIIASDERFASLDADSNRDAARISGVEMNGDADRIWSELERRLNEQTLRESAGAARWPLYVTAEKILGADEELREQWAVHGTSGYDFLARLNGLFVDAASASIFDRNYREFIGNDTPLGDIVYDSKKLVLRISLASELQMLAHQLDRLAQRNRHWRDFTLGSLRHALREVIACFPVYRSYIATQKVSDPDARDVERAVRKAMARNPDAQPAVFDFIRDVLLQRYPQTFGDEDRAAQLRFAGKFQQVTAPVTAKGIEDTTFYIYNRFVSLNEVGGDPNRFGTSPEALHRWLHNRQLMWPYALSPLSTHDTKRSEDVRARLNVLSGIPDEWWQRVARWSRLNAPLRRMVNGLAAPDRNDEYLLYQTLLGAWPIRAGAIAQQPDYAARIQAYVQKALREAKVHTNWTRPNADYENAVHDFVAAIFDEHKSAIFLQDFLGLERRVSHFGLLNSLAQTTLRLAAPGVPDTYQGAELWDLSLVDPDNRRPVDYRRRTQMLRELQSRAAQAGADFASLAADLIASKEDGRVKLWIIWRGLACRRENPGLFSTGDYLPLEIVGEHRDHAFAFLRRAGDQWALVAAPRLMVGIVPAAGALPVGKSVWGDTKILLPTQAGQVRFRNIFTEQTIAFDPGSPASGILLARLFDPFPFALCISRTSPKLEAGNMENRSDGFAL